MRTMMNSVFASYWVRGTPQPAIWFKWKPQQQQNKLQKEQNHWNDDIVHTIWMFVFVAIAMVLQTMAFSNVYFLFCRRQDVLKCIWCADYAILCCTWAKFGCIDLFLNQIEWKWIYEWQWNTRIESFRWIRKGKMNKYS